MQRPVSDSSIGKLLACPALYAHAYVWKTPKGEVLSDPNMGIAFHRLAKVLCIRYLETGRWEMLKGDLASVMHLLASTILEQSIEAMRSFAATPPPWEFDGGKLTQVEVPIAVGKDWELCDWDDPEALVRGRLDTVSEHSWGLASDDWKTSFMALTPAEMQVEPQARLYGLLLFVANRWVDRARIRFRYVRYPRSIRYADFARDVDYHAMQQEVEALYAMQDRDEWPECPGSHCTYCPYSGGCQAFNALPDLASSEQLEELPEFLARFIATKAWVAKAEKKARKMVAERGSVQLPDGRWYGVWEGRKSKTVVGVKELAEALAERGVELEEVMPHVSLSGKALEKLLYDVLQESEVPLFLEKHVIESVGTEFAVRKVNQ